MIWTTKPKTLILETTNRCNLKCRMCDIWKEKPKKDMGVDQIAGILRDPTAAKIKCLSFTGGEPFLIPNFTEYLRQARKSNRNCHINISTNGYDTDAIISAVTRGLGNDCRASLTLSYDGKSHDKIRGVSGASDRLLQTALAAKQKLPTIKLALKFTVTRWNNKEIQSATNLSEKLGIALFIRIVEYQPCYTSRLSKRKQMCHE
ncbi:MAG: radical SAM protein, partial [Candidatus Woesearchaeota archaeon]